LGLFLVFWAVGTFLIYTIASEKMPWLIVNITVPFIILSAKLMGDLIENLPWRRLLPSLNVSLLLIAPLFLAAGIYLLQHFLDSGKVESLSGWAAVGVTAALGAAIVVFLYRAKPAAGLGLVTLGMAVLLLGFSAFVAFRATYHSGDGPVEMLVYAGASDDVRQLATDLRQQPFLEDPSERVQVDYEIWYPFNWYVRNDGFVEFRCYKDESEDGYVDWCTPLEQTSSATGLVLLESHSRRDAQYLLAYDRQGPFRDLLWFPESYRRPGENRQEETLWQEVRKGRRKGQHDRGNQGRRTAQVVPQKVGQAHQGGAEEGIG